MRLIPSRRTLTDTIAPVLLAVVIQAVVAYAAYRFGYADARLSLTDDLRVQTALVNGYAEHDAADDATIAELTRERDDLVRERDALMKDFADLEDTLYEVVER